MISQRKRAKNKDERNSYVELIKSVYVEGILTVQP